MNHFSREKDKEWFRVQNNLSVVLNGLGHSMTLLLDEAQIDKKKILSIVSDSARYLGGTQYSISLLRRKLLRGHVKDKAMKDIPSSSSVYPCLFGADLTTAVKTAQTLSKAGKDLTRSQFSSVQEKPSSSKNYGSRQPHKSGENSLNSKRPLLHQYHQQKKNNGQRASYFFGK